MFRKLTIVAIPLVLIAAVWIMVADPAGPGIPLLAGAENDTPCKPGDTVVVVVDKTQLMVGKTISAELPKGTTLRVIEVKGSWVGGRAELDGKIQKGWVRISDVRLAGAIEPATTKPEVVKKTKEPAEKAQESSSKTEKPATAKAEPAQKTEPAKKPEKVATTAKEPAKSATPPAASTATPDSTAEEKQERVEELAERLAKLVAERRALEAAAKSPEKSTTETKPAETKPAETKPAEVKPAEVKPAEVRPAETKPAETRPAETKPAETKPAETKPVETKPAETKPAVAEPAETKPAETKPGAAQPKKLSDEWARILEEMKRAKKMRESDLSGGAALPANATANGPAAGKSAPTAKPAVTRPAVPASPKVSTSKPPKTDIVKAARSRLTGAPETVPQEPAKSALPKPSDIKPPVFAQPPRVAQAEGPEERIDIHNMVARRIEQIEEADRSARIGQLTLTGGRFSDRSLKYLDGLSVQQLSIEASSITNGGLKYLAGVQDIKFLRLWSPRFNDGALKYIVQLQDLEDLDIQGSCVEGRNLEMLAELKRLNSLALGPLTTDDALGGLAKVTTLRQLDLRACQRLTEASFETIAKLDGVKLVLLPDQIARRGRNYLRKHMPGCQVR